MWKNRGSRTGGLGAVFFLSERSLQLGPASDIPSKIYCHALALGVGFSHSEKTLAGSVLSDELLCGLLSCPPATSTAWTPSPMLGCSSWRSPTGAALRTASKGCAGRPRSGACWCCTGWAALALLACRVSHIFHGDRNFSF
jgi:hypothetical protein